jgi:hypothetical protein
LKKQGQVMNGLNPVENKEKRVQSLLALEQQATDLDQQGAPPDAIAGLIDSGAKAVAANFPDLPEYEKAVSAAGRYKQMKIAANPQATLNTLPLG